MMLLVPHRRRRAAAFTLVELLVVIGIVALLMGLLLVGVTRARVRGKAAKTASDLQAIAVALDAFKADTGDYPRPVAPPWSVANAGGGFDYPLIGAETLCKALLAPGPASPPLNASGLPTSPYGVGQIYVSPVAAGASQTTCDYICVSATTAAPPGPAWFPTSVITSDGADGPGFRMRAGGPPHQPYLNAEAFPITNGTQGFALMDGYGRPILYCPAALNRGNINIYAFAAGPGAVQPFVDQNGLTSGPSLYDADAIAQDFTYSSDATIQPAINRIRMCLGDLNNNGAIDSGETAATTGPYLLWSAGNDGIYGPDGTGKSDDVTNFDLPPGIRK